MIRDLPVYTGAVWWRYCDPHTIVVALSATAAEQALTDACAESLAVANSDEEKVIDDQCWSGIHTDSLRQVLASMSKRARRDCFADLRGGGVYYCDTP